MTAGTSTATREPTGSGRSQGSAPRINKGTSMMISANEQEARRTSPLAFWRYGHDYLRAARTLCRQHRIPCAEAQVSYHAAAQGVEFALKAFLRARGTAADALRTEVGHSLPKALDRSEALGMPPIPEPRRAAAAE